MTTAIQNRPVELNFRFSNRLKVREVTRILLENQESDIWIIVWPMKTHYYPGDGSNRYITVSVIPVDRDFTARLLATDGLPSMETRETMSKEASKWLEMFQGEKVRQFAAWTKK